MFELRAVPAVVALAVAASPVAAAITGYSVAGSGDDWLYAIDLMTGAETPIGPTGYGEILALSFRPGTATLYGVDATTGTLVTIDTATGAGAPVGAIGIGSTVGVGLAWDHAGNLWLANELDEGFYALDPATGAATFVGTTGQSVSGLAFRDGVLYGVADQPDHNLVEIDTTTGLATTIGALGVTGVSFAGIDFDPAGTLRAVLSAVGGANNVATIDVLTGAATLVAPLSDRGFGSLAILPAPGALALLIAAGALKRHRRRAGGA